MTYTFTPTVGTGVMAHEVPSWLPLVTHHSGTALVVAALEADRYQGEVLVTVEYAGMYAGRSELLRIIPSPPRKEA